MPHARPRRAVAALIALALSAAFVLIGAVHGLVPTAAAASGGGQAVCPHDGEWRKIDGLSGTSYEAVASEGKVIVEVCVKSGQTTQQYDVDAAQTVTIETPSTNVHGNPQDISHVAVREIEANGGWPYPAPTCDATLTVTYPQGVSGNHVNARVRNLDTDETVDVNLHKPSGAWSGEQTFDLTTGAAWPDWTRAALEWIQVDGDNYHWIGHVELGCDTPTPTPSPSESSTPSPAPSPSEPAEAPAEASLAGSVAVGECLADAPWITYDVRLTDEAGQVDERAVRLVLTDGTDTETLELGDLDDDGTLSGRVLWPGASVADDGETPTGWPGWEQLADGTWAETDGNFAWTRGDVTATLAVNPELDVDLAYPVATPECAAAPPVETVGTDDAAGAPEAAAPVAEAVEAAAPTASPQAVSASADGELAQTGASVWLYAVGALLLVGIGGVALVLRRRV